MHIGAVKCVQIQVQHTLSEVQVIVNAEFEATISARVSPIIVLNVFLVERLRIAWGFFWG
jgi:hypothetical protein